ncbi:MIP family channel protein [Nocardioides gilvus]|uniref:MIP family channel protein n=1 Tax=Nocardioides gilvus TaxID=1735589 RepID=UPI000D74ACF1|nr:MIP family channel protein [Nocardioides gilvus]
MTSETGTDTINAQPTIGHKIAAEVVGTFVLVFFGVGAALMSGGDYVATGLSFGISVLVMAAAVGRISGGHFNPAVTLGASLDGRLPWALAPLYMLSQVVGGVLAGSTLLFVMNGFPTFDVAETGLGQNSFGDLSANDFGTAQAFFLEALLTMLFIWVILAVTDKRNGVNSILAPLAIGLALAMIHFASMSATGTSVNPARSIGPALFAGADAISQLWLFILAPLVGAAVGGLTYRFIFGREPAAVTPVERVSGA